MLEEAITFHRSGQFAEAERLYRDILRQQPDNAQVGHLLGQLGMDAGLPHLAIPVLERVLTLDPGNADAHNDLGKCLHMTKRLQEAVNSFDRAIALQPGLIDAYNNRAISLQGLGQSQKAAENFELALALAPDNSGALSNSATGLIWLGRYEEALARLDAALALAPENEGLYFNRAEVLKLLRRHEDALADFDKALTLDPNFANAHFNRGLLLARIDRFADALPALERAIALAPSAAMHISRGLVLARIGRFNEALVAFDTAKALAPDFSDAYVSQMLILAQMGRTDEAIAYGREMAANLGLREDMHLNLSLLLLQQGNWAEGWALYEARKTCSIPTEMRIYPQPAWLGTTSLQGKTLYVHAEQGHGDAIQFCRYLLTAKDQGAHVIFSAPDVLVRLLSSMDADIQVLALQEVPAQFDCHVALLSLPLALNITPENAAPVIPYLHAEAERVTKWREKIGAQGFKIGICWSGSINTTNFTFGLERSFALRQLEMLGKLPGVRLISLQKENIDELYNLPAGMVVETLGADFDCGPDAFMDTAAAMQSLDLIISCDTSVAHLAGALGRPIWLALYCASDWRWLLGRSDSPWYPTMTLFRQTAPGDWATVFAPMQDKLKTLLKSG